MCPTQCSDWAPNISKNKNVETAFSLRPNFLDLFWALTCQTSFRTRVPRPFGWDLSMMRPCLLFFSHLWCYVPMSDSVCAPLKRNGNSVKGFTSGLIVPNGVIVQAYYIIYKTLVCERNTREVELYSKFHQRQISSKAPRERHSTLQYSPFLLHPPRMLALSEICVQKFSKLMS